MSKTNYKKNLTDESTYTIEAKELFDGQGPGSTKLPNDL